MDNWKDLVLVTIVPLFQLIDNKIFSSTVELRRFEVDYEVLVNFYELKDSQELWETVNNLVRISVIELSHK